MWHERPCSDAAPHMTLPSTLSPILGTWPDQKLQDTWQSLHCACFKGKGAWVQANLHDWDMNCHTSITVMPREILQLTEADTESEGKGDCKLGRLSAVRFRDWGFLYWPWNLPCFWKGMGQVSLVDKHFSLSCPSASSMAPSSISSISCSRSGTRAHVFFCMCTRS